MAPKLWRIGRLSRCGVSVVDDAHHDALPARAGAEANHSNALFVFVLFVDSQIITRA